MRTRYHTVRGKALPDYVCDGAYAARRALSC